MKKLITRAGCALAAGILLMGSLSACKKNNAAESEIMGILSMLNMTEENYNLMRTAVYEVNDILEEEGYVLSTADLKSQRPAKCNVRYYDTLQSLLMAVKSGEIHAIGEISQTTALYLCAKDPDLVMPYHYDISKIRGESSDGLYEGISEAFISNSALTEFARGAFERLANGFSFMMLDKNTGLRDQFNAAIREISKDGTLKKLIDGQILAAINGSELEPIIPEYKSGRATIKVAVTGDLPPMDYVAADGTFAGFNTALLAEIGKRLDKNITMIQVSSIGRATALASGTVDVVFWTRSSSQGSKNVTADSSSFRAKIASLRQNSSEREGRAMAALTAGIKGNTKRSAREIAYDKDMPAGTVLTEPYFVDMPVVVVSKR